jgi:hypothetical protein
MHNGKIDGCWQVGKYISTVDLSQAAGIFLYVVVPFQARP